MAQRFTCPECGGSRVRRKSTLRSFGLSVALFVLLVLLMGYVVPEDWFHVRVFVSLGALFSFGAMVAAGFSALIGRNRCMDCGHRWRKSMAGEGNGPGTAIKG